MQRVEENQRKADTSGALGAGTWLLPQSTARAWSSGGEGIYQIGLIREI